MSDRPDRLETALYSNPMRNQPRAAPRRNPQTYSGGAVPDDNSITIGFDHQGNYTESVDDYLAKRVETIRSVRYYVLFGTTGPDIGRMVNPRGLYFNMDDIRKVNNQRGRGRYEFRVVPESSFREYLKFLTSRTESYLRNAERQVLDA